MAIGWNGEDRSYGKLYVSGWDILRIPQTILTRHALNYTTAGNVG